ncbi:MAG: adenine-specific methyltransferase EcoRI family protein [Treponema sp.]|nr:adenine-specific methyltransferase EcoRI family protein [Treponema sp.]
MTNENLRRADAAKNDEFYTQFQDIQKEINAYLEYDANVFRNKTVLLPCDDPEWSNFTKFFAHNFETLGLKKLISTSYAADSKPKEIDYQPTLFESVDPRFDVAKTRRKGKIFTLTEDENKDGKINFDDLKWDYLDGDGDFRSNEVKRLRDEADFIITNPPFSLFREFMAWLLESKKNFSVIGNINALSYKEIFPLIKENKLWLGATNFNTGMYFRVPESFIYASSYKFEKEQNGVKVNRVPGVCWFTNIEHGRRHQPLSLMTENENLKYSKHKEIKGIGYKKFDFIDAINVPFTDAIPSDYTDVMGVPITFLDKYCPNQFEIIDGLNRYTILDVHKKNDWAIQNHKHLTSIDGKPQYFRILIRKKGD